MDKPWDEIKKEYWYGVLVFAFFVFLSFISAPRYTQNELTTKLVTLSEKPVFKESSGKGKRYWVELFFLEDSKKYEIDGIDYKYINYSLFSKLDKGDRATIKVNGENIFSFEKDDIDYMNFEKAQYHKSQNKIFSLGIFITGLICCIIPLFFTSYPVLKIGAQNIRIRFGWILFVSIIVAFVILSKHIELQYLSSLEFAK